MVRFEGALENVKIRMLFILLKMPCVIYSYILLSKTRLLYWICMARFL